MSQGKIANVEKKTLAASERREEERASFREQMKEIDARRLVVVDECGSNIVLTPPYARAHKGQRATQSGGKYHLAGLVIALRHWSFDDHGRSSQCAAFEAYVEQILAPQPGSGEDCGDGQSERPQKRTGAAVDRDAGLRTALLVCLFS